MATGHARGSAATAHTEKVSGPAGKDSGPTLEERVATLEARLAEVIHHCGHQPVDS